MTIEQLQELGLGDVVVNDENDIAVVMHQRGAEVTAIRIFLIDAERRKFWRLRMKANHEPVEDSGG